MDGGIWKGKVLGEGERYRRKRERNMRGNISQKSAKKEENKTKKKREVRIRKDRWRDFGINV